MQRDKKGVSLKSDFLAIIPINLNHISNSPKAYFPILLQRVKTVTLKAYLYFYDGTEISESSTFAKNINSKLIWLLC